MMLKMEKKMALKQVDGVIVDVETANISEKRDEILKDMSDTIAVQNQINDIVDKRASEISNQDIDKMVKGGYRYHGINTQFKQVSLNTTRRSYRRRFPLGIRYA